MYMLKMNWCKTALAMLLAFFFVTGYNLYAQDSTMQGQSGNAQGNDVYKQNAQKWTDQLDQRLSLTEEQKTRVQGILVDFQQANISATADNKDQLKTTYDSRIESVLNDNQKSMYNSYKDEWWSTITASNSGTSNQGQGY
jgi:hypothetical protein